jgi:hypothetical protein
MQITVELGRLSNFIHHNHVQAQCGAIHCVMGSTCYESKWLFATPRRKKVTELIKTETNMINNAMEFTNGAQGHQDRLRGRVYPGE